MVTIFAINNVISHVYCFVLVRQYLSKYVCSAQYGLFCSSLISCFPGMLLRYYLSDFELGPLSSFITGITFAFTFHMR